MKAPRGRSREHLPAGFGTIWATVAIDLIGFGVILPILPLYAERFGASPTDVGLLLASFSVAQLVFAPIWGRLSDHVGRRPVILISLFGTAIGCFITGAAGALWVLFAGRIIDGISGASVSVAQAAVTDVAPPEQRAHLLGLLSAAFGVGFVAGPALGALATLGGPHVPFYVAGAIALVNGVVALRRLPETAGARGERAFAGAVSLDAPGGPSLAPDLTDPAERRRSLARLALVAFVATVAFSAFEATFSLFGKERFGLREGSTSAVFVGIGLLLVAVQAGLVRRVAPKYGGLRTLRAGLAANATGLLLLAAATEWIVLMPGLVLLVVGQGLTSPSLTSVAAGRARADRRGAALGVQQSAGGLARVVGPAAGGLLFQHAGLPWPYLVGAALLAAAGAILLAEHEPVPASRPAVA